MSTAVSEPPAKSAPPAVRRLRVRHGNYYQYDQPISRSVHRLHLRPIHDRKQTLVSHGLQVTPDAALIEYEDVFGNWTTRFEMASPYSQLSIVAESTVDLLDVDPFAFLQLSARPKFPVQWMPWEFNMLAPYLSPVELPETQLREILDFSKSFATRNQLDVYETLFDMNLTLFREFAYTPKSTTLKTTPFDVLTAKQGVCQDFANLMICMARLLHLPARYVCGYVFTGNTGENKVQSDATHAWVQIFLPDVGWKDFDPTNGVLPATDHVRMAVGRHYRDTAPTAGTLYSPAQEHLRLDVEVTPVE
ncbi:MAG: transglutaminase N-terminal domain-containing protein [Pirellulales bacterium]